MNLGGKNGLVASADICGIRDSYDICADPRGKLGTESVSWPSTDGQITSSETVYYEVGEGGRSSVFRVSYTYKVCGKAYSSSVRHIGCGDILSPPKSIISKYLLGAHVKVYFDPSKPQVATLETGVSTSGFLIGLIGASVSIGFGVRVFQYIFGR